MSWLNIEEMPCVIAVIKTAEAEIKMMTGSEIHLHIDPFEVNIGDQRKKILQYLVCAYFKVTWQEVESQSRETKTNLLDARHVYMFLSRSLLRQSLEDTGKDCKRDHTSVMHAVKKINGFYQVGDKLVNDIEAIKKQFQHETKIK